MKKPAALPCALLALLLLSGCAAQSAPSALSAVSATPASSAAASPASSPSAAPSSLPESEPLPDVSGLGPPYHDIEVTTTLLSEGPEGSTYRCVLPIGITTSRTISYILPGASYAITVTVPSGYTVSSGGTPVFTNSAAPKMDVFAAVLLPQSPPLIEYVTPPEDVPDFHTYLDYGVKALDDGRTLYYDSLYSTYNGPGNVYSYALQLNDDWAICLTFYESIDLDAARWTPYCESIVASVQPSEE